MFKGRFDVAFLCNSAFMRLRQKNGKFKASQSLYKGDTLSEKQKQSKKQNRNTHIHQIQTTPKQKPNGHHMWFIHSVPFKRTFWPSAEEQAVWVTLRSVVASMTLNAYPVMGLAFWLLALASSRL